MSAKKKIETTKPSRSDAPTCSTPAENLLTEMEKSKVVALGSDDGISLQTATEIVGGLAKLSDHFDDQIRKHHPNFGK